MPRSFRLRGIVEGFYGPPWSHEARLDVLTFVGERGMNAYVYAPKDDARHRERWREPYDADELDRFRALAAHARTRGIRFGFAISPGLDVDYESRADRAALVDKLAPITAAGVTWVLLLLDDIPMQAGLAPRQAGLATWLLETLRAEHADVDLALCPTEYVGTRPTPYLAELGAGLPPDVDVMWTGPTVCSPTLTAADAGAWADALGGRPPLVWDNYPVNDATMAHSLHLGPYRGREAALADTTAGILCNPMVQPRASQVALATAAEFLTEPDAYDPDVAWERAVADVGGTRAPALRSLAAACAHSALAPPDDLEAHRLVRALDAAVDGPSWIEPLQALASVFRTARDVPEVLTDEDDLGRELAPWARAAALEAATALHALRLVQAVRPVAAIADGEGRAVGPSADAALEHVFALSGAWGLVHRQEAVAYGPRYESYPALAMLPDGRLSLDTSVGLLENRNAVDVLCRLALRAHEGWRADPTAPVRVFVDGQERPVGPDGRFDGRGTTVLVRAGALATRCDASTGLPFRDRRLP